MPSDTEILMGELTRAGESALAEQLERAQYGSTGSEILGDIGAALFRNPGARAKLGPEGRRAWDDLKGQVDRAFPGWGFRVWLSRLWPWRKT